MAPVNRTDQLPRLLPGTAATLNLDEHLARYGPLPLRPAGDLIAEVRAAGLTGRGGAAFPAGTKLAAVAAAAAATAASFVPAGKAAPPRPVSPAARTSAIRSPAGRTGSGPYRARCSSRVSVAAVPGSSRGS